MLSIVSPLGYAIVTDAMDKNKLKLVRVYSTASASDAHLVRNYLEDQGIEARVTGDGLAHSGLAGVASVDVYTFENQSQEAVELLKNWTP